MNLVALLGIIVLVVGALFAGALLEGGGAYSAQRRHKPMRARTSNWLFVAMVLCGAVGFLLITAAGGGR